MRGREHVLLGAGSVVVAGVGAQVAGVEISTWTLAGAVVAAAAGSLAPDLDHPGSLASLGIPSTLLAYGGVFLLLPLFTKKSAMLSALDLSNLPGTYRAAAWLAVLSAVALFGLSFAAGAFFGHRGAVHSFVFGIAGTFGVGAATLVLSGPWWVPFLFAWGWITHLAADATTKMGLPCALWPWQDDRTVR